VPRRVRPWQPHPALLLVMVLAGGLAGLAGAYARWEELEARAASARADAR